MRASIARSLLGLLAFVPFSVCPQAAPAGGVIYVDVDAASGGDGLSWQSALQHPQAALELAVSSSGGLTEIWIAEGTYTPTAAISGADPRTRTFLMVQGVSLYGGFSGVESSIAERNLEAHTTTLSGDVLGNDTAGGGGLAENVYHVVRAFSEGFACRLDGFDIRGGNASDGSAPDNAGAGAHLVGSGICIIENCRFYDNHAAASGAGAYVRASEWTSSYVIRNCVFEHNTAAAAAGLYAWGGTIGVNEVSDCAFVSNAVSGSAGGAWISWANVKRCLFLDNSAVQGVGGGLSANGNIVACSFLGNVITGLGTSTLARGGGLGLEDRGSVTQCVFSGNRAGDEGGGLWIQLPESEVIDIDGCSFSANQARLGAAIHTAGSPTTTISNSVFWENSSLTGPEIGFHSFAPLVTFCDVEGGWAGLGNISADPLFVDARGADGLAGTLDDDLRLAAGSPCIDQGSNHFLLTDDADLDVDGDFVEQVPLDQGGNLRRVDDLATLDGGQGASPVVDMGALEHQPSCGSVVAYCQTSPNSVGAGAVISHLGTPEVSGAGFQLQIAGGVPNQHGVYFYGGAQAATPFGDGLLCVGAGTAGLFRFAPVQIDLFGFATMPVDFNAPPASAGPGALLGGSTWNFQFWYRDPQAGATGFHTSDALSVVFCP